MPEGCAPPVATAPVLGALRRIMRPIAHFLIAYQIPFPAFAALLKAVYVEVADSEFPIVGKRQTDSRINLLTGVHRKDIRTLRAAPKPAMVTPPIASLGAQLVARWTTRDEYRDADGRPKPLARLAAHADGPSFESLVQTVSKDIRPRAVLDEWLRLRIASLDAEDRVSLNEAAFVPRRGEDELFYFFGRNLSAHLSAGVRNVLAEEPPFLERSVYYNELTPASVAELEALSKTLGMEALQAVNARALALQERDAGAPDATRAMNFGVYFFFEDEEDETEPRHTGSEGDGDE